MLKRTLILATLLTLGLGSMGAFSTVQDAPASPEAAAKSKTFEVDAVHSTAIFKVHHLGAGRFYGRFNDVTGDIEYTQGSRTGHREGTAERHAADTLRQRVHVLVNVIVGPTRHVMSGCRWSLPAAWDVIEGNWAVSEES